MVSQSLNSSQEYRLFSSKCYLCRYSKYLWNQGKMLSMSDLTNMEKRAFEKLLEMSSGYVLDFSNRTLDDFVMDSVGKSIYDNKYDHNSGSKANRLRAFWIVEPNHVVATLMRDLLEYAKDERGLTSEKCDRIVERLSLDMPVPDIEVITAYNAEKEFSVLAETVRDSIEKNQPEVGLDRLHTFTIKYLRMICEKHGINTGQATTSDKQKPLHSLMGEYIKSLKNEGLIESEMTERILKTSLSNLEAFNKVRNEQSYAHDNQILNYEESLLIFNQITSIIRFLESIERKCSVESAQNTSASDDWEVPF